MAFHVPTTTVAGQTVWHLAQLPSYEEFLSFARSEQFSNQLAGFLSSAFADTEVDASFGGLNSYYEKLFEKTRNELPPQSSVYHYITLKSDFRTLQDKVFRRETSFDGSEMTDEILKETEQLYHPDRFADAIQNRENDLRACTEIFEFLSLLELLYFHQVIELSLSSTYLSNIVSAEINRHNAMVAIRRGQRGQTKEQILPYLIREPRLVHRLLVESLEFGDILGEIGHALSLNPETLSENAIETYLTHEEIRAINTAKYEGVDAERIVQYLEVVYHFLSNVKLAMAAHQFGLPMSQVEERFVNYNT